MGEAMTACIWCKDGYIVETGIMCRSCHGSGKQADRGSKVCNRCHDRPVEFVSPDALCEPCWREWWNAGLPN